MLISIIIASYNYENYIVQAIESVISQTYTDWELIIVDDGSTDNSMGIIQSYVNKDARIKFYTHDNFQNKGLVETLKLGISKATGDWIAFLESDDMWETNCLEERVKNPDNLSDCGIIFNTVKLIGSEHKIKSMQPIVNRTRNRLLKLSFPTTMFDKFAIDNQILTFSSVMIKKSAILPEYFNCPIDKLFDWWLYIHLAKYNKFLYIDSPLTAWRMHDDSYISKKAERLHILQIEAYFDILKNEFSIGMLFRCSIIFFKLLFSLKFLKSLKAYLARTIKKVLKIS